MTRPCRPCAAYAATAALYGLPEHKVQPGRFRVVWPPRRLRVVFPQCGQAIVDTCKWHARGIWPISLYLALAAETEDVGFTTMNVTGSALDTMLAGKGTRLSHRSTMYGARANESVDAVLAAYRETGTYAAAGRLLDQQHVPTRGGASWQPSMVAWIVQLAGA